MDQSPTVKASEYDRYQTIQAANSVRQIRSRVCYRLSHSQFLRSVLGGVGFSISLSGFYFILF